MRMVTKALSHTKADEQTGKKKVTPAVLARAFKEYMKSYEPLSADERLRYKRMKKNIQSGRSDDDSDEDDSKTPITTGALTSFVNAILGRK